MKFDTQKINKKVFSQTEQKWKPKTAPYKKEEKDCIGLFQVIFSPDVFWLPSAEFF